MSQNTKTYLLALRDTISTINETKEYASYQINLLYWKMCEYARDYNKHDDTKGILECYFDYIDIILKYLETKDFKSYKEYKSSITKYMGVVADIQLLSPVIMAIDGMVDVTTKILERVTDPSIKASCAKELTRAYNNIIKSCDRSIKEELVNSETGIYLLKLIDILCSCGDFEYQTFLLETIFRVCPNTFIKSKAADFFPEAESLQTALIKFDVKRFDSSRRIFLNTVNSVSGGVFSFVAEHILLDEVNVEPPVDVHGNRQQLWIDFNKKTGTIGIYCQQSCLKTDMLSQDDDESGWELITIFVKDVGLVETKRSSTKNESLFKFTLTTPFYVQYPGSEAVTKSKFLRVVTGDPEVIRELQEIVLPRMFQSKFKNTRNLKKKSRISVRSLSRKDSFKGIYKPLRVKKSVRSKSITSAGTRSIKSLEDVLNVPPALNGVKTVDISSDSVNCNLDTQYFSAQENSERIIQETPKRGNVTDMNVKKSGAKIINGPWDKLRVKFPFIRKCVLTRKISLDPGVSPILETNEISHSRKSPKLAENKKNETNQKLSENVSELELCSQMSVLSSQCRENLKREGPSVRNSIQCNSIQDSMDSDIKEIKSIRTYTRKGNQKNKNSRDREETYKNNFLDDTENVIEEARQAQFRSSKNLTQENCIDVVNFDNPAEADAVHNENCEEIIIEDDQYFTAPLEFETNVKKRNHLETQREMLESSPAIPKVVHDAVDKNTNNSQKMLMMHSEEYANDVINKNMSVINTETNKKDIKRTTTTQNEIVAAQELNRQLKNTSDDDTAISVFSDNLTVREDKVLRRNRNKETRSQKDKHLKIYGSYTSLTSDSNNSEPIQIDLGQTTVASQHSIRKGEKDASRTNSQQNSLQTNKNTFADDIATTRSHLVTPRNMHENKVKRDSQENNNCRVLRSTSRTSGAIEQMHIDLDGVNNNHRLDVEHPSLSSVPLEKPNKQVCSSKIDQHQNNSKFKEPPRRNKDRKAKRQNDKRCNMSSSSSAVSEHTNSDAKQNCLEQINENVDQDAGSDNCVNKSYTSLEKTNKKISSYEKHAQEKNLYKLTESDDDSTFVDESLINESNQRINELKVTDYMYGMHVDKPHTELIDNMLPIINKQLSSLQSRAKNEIIDLTQSDDEQTPENINSINVMNLQSEVFVKPLEYPDSDRSSQVISGNNTFAIKQSKKLKSQILRKSQIATAKNVTNIIQPTEINKKTIQEEVIKNNEDNKLSDDDNVIRSKDTKQILETDAELFIEKQNSLFDQFLQDAVTKERNNKITTKNVETIIDMSSDNTKGKTENEELHDSQSENSKKSLEDKSTKPPNSNGHQNIHTSEVIISSSQKKAESVNIVEERGSKMQEFETLVPNKNEHRQLRTRKLTYVQPLNEKALNAATETTTAFDDSAVTSKVLPKTRGRKNNKIMSQDVETKVEEHMSSENVMKEIPEENVVVEFALNSSLNHLQRSPNKNNEKLCDSYSENINNQEDLRKSYIKPFQENLTKSFDISGEPDAQIFEDGGSNFQKKTQEVNIIKESGSQKTEFEALITKDNQRRLGRRTLYNLQLVEKEPLNASEQPTRKFEKKAATLKLLPKKRGRKKKRMQEEVVTPKKSENIGKKSLRNDTLESNNFDEVQSSELQPSSAFNNFIAETEIAGGAEESSDLQHVCKDVNNNATPIKQLNKVLAEQNIMRLTNQNVESVQRDETNEDTRKQTDTTFTSYTKKQIALTKIYGSKNECKTIELRKLNSKNDNEMIEMFPIKRSNKTFDKENVDPLGNESIENDLIDAGGKENNIIINATISSSNRIENNNSTQEPKNSEQNLEKLKPPNDIKLFDVNTEKIISSSQRRRSRGGKRKLSQSDTPLFVKPSQGKRYKLHDPNDFTYLEDQASYFARESSNSARRTKTNTNAKGVSGKSRSISKKKEEKPHSSKSKSSAATSFHASKKRNYSRRVDAADSDTTRVNTRQVEFDTFITSFIDDFNKSKMKRNKKRISKNSISSKNVRKHRINTSFEFGANSESETEISPLKVKILENILIQPAEHEINRENELKEIEKENSEQMWRAMLKVFHTISIAKNEMLDALIKYAPHDIKDGPEYEALLKKHQSS